MKYKISILFLFQICFIYAESQNIKFAKQIIDSLCSPAFHGRGYDFNTNFKTSEFLKSEFKTLKLKQFNKTYFQDFKLSVNTFQGEMSIISGDSVLVAGRDYTVSGFSSQIKGNFPIVRITAQTIKDSLALSNVLKSNQSKNIILLDTFGLHNKTFDKLYKEIAWENKLKSKGIIVIVDKLPAFAPSQETENFVQIQILRTKSNNLKDSVTINIDNKFLKDFPVKNVLGFIKGKSDTCIVISAHYDHVGQFGKNVYFPGANDNASGVAMVLNLAEYFSKQKAKPRYTIVFLLFAGEELGILGSKYYTENPVFPISKIKFLINLDMVGSGENGIQIVNSTVFTKEFDLLNSINSEKKYLTQIKKRGAAANSDHYFFYEKGVRCFFVYTLGNYKEYHNIYDRSDKLPLNKFEDLTSLIRDFITKLN